MGMADTIKARVTMRQVVEFYGFSVGRAGFIQCPFHTEKTASLKLYDDTNAFYCFGCGAHGSVIDFVMGIEHCGTADACRKLDSAFDLGLFKTYSFKERRAATQEAVKRKRVLQQREAQRDYSRQQYNKLTQYYRWLKQQKPTKETIFDMDYLDRLLDRFLLSDAIITFDADARINALLSKYKDRGEYDLQRNKY